VHRVAAQLPDATAGPQSISVRELRELQVRLLQQQRRARRRTSLADHRRFEQGRRDPCRCERMCHQSTGHPATNNRDTRFMFAAERGIASVRSGAALEPQRSAAAKCSLRRAHHEADVGSASHTRSRSSGQQLMTLSAGIAAKRACANAVSAYASCPTVCASLSSANRHPAARARDANV
jgi:hypothetical protein